MSIDCVAIPSTVREIGDLAVLFTCWNLLHGHERITDRLVITFSGSHDNELLDKIERLAELHALDNLFGSLEVRFLEIPADEDIYIRNDNSDWNGAMPRLGLKSGPNLQFFRTIGLLGNCQFTFLNEADVFPLSKYWLSRLASTLRPGHDWVLGSYYRGDTQLGPDIVSHINGAAVYATGNTAFQAFCSEYWEPWLAEMCNELPDTAYDIWASRLRHKFSCDQSSWENLDKAVQKDLIEGLARFSVTDKIANLSLKTDLAPIEDLLTRGFELVHGKHFRAGALSNAIQKGRIEGDRRLTRVQAYSLLAHNNNNPELAATLDDIISPKAISVANRLTSKINRNDSKGQTCVTQEIASTNFTAITNYSHKHDRQGIQEHFTSGDCNTLIAFSPYKAGSTLLFTGLELMQAPYFMDMKYQSYYDEYFSQFGVTNNSDFIRYMQDKANSGGLFEENRIYGGFRDCIPFTSSKRESPHVDIFNYLFKARVRAHIVFLMRDPRDCLVSLYYSHKNSHAITSDQSYLVTARVEANSLDISAYISANSIEYKINTSKILALIDGCRQMAAPHSIFAYEDVFFRQDHLFRSIASSMRRDFTEEMWLELMRRSGEVSSTPLGFRPDHEDSSRHIRRGTPGDYKSKLDAGLRARMTALFREELDLLKRINPEYEY